MRGQHIGVIGASLLRSASVRNTKYQHLLARAVSLLLSYCPKCDATRARALVNAQIISAVHAGYLFIDAAVQPPLDVQSTHHA